MAVADHQAVALVIIVNLIVVVATRDLTERNNNCLSSVIRVGAVALSTWSLALESLPKLKSIVESF